MLVTSNSVSFILLCLAVFRIYLEVINFKFEKLPLTAKMPAHFRKNFHKSGLFFCIGYVLLFGPEYLFY